MHQMKRSEKPLNLLRVRLQPLSRRVHLRQRWSQPQLWLHQLRHLRLGLPLALPPHDAGLLGEPLPAGRWSVPTCGLHAMSERTNCLCARGKSKRVVSEKGCVICVITDQGCCARVFCPLRAARRSCLTFAESPHNALTTTKTPNKSDNSK